MTTHATTTRRTPPAHRAGNLFIALVVWGGGVAFTRQALPLPAGADALGFIAPWALAIVIQLALSLGQTNLRAYGLASGRWPYLILLLLDIGVNAVGLLVTYGMLSTPGAALPYAVRALTSGAGLWELVAAIAAGSIVAMLPESLLRDAR